MNRRFAKNEQRSVGAAPTATPRSRRCVAGVQALEKTQQWADDSTEKTAGSKGFSFYKQLPVNFIVRGCANPVYGPVSALKLFFLGQA